MPTVFYFIGPCLERKYSQAMGAHLARNGYRTQIEVGKSSDQK